MYIDVILLILCVLYVYFGLVMDSFMQWPLMAVMIIISTINIYNRGSENYD